MPGLVPPYLCLMLPAATAPTPPWSSGGVDGLCLIAACLPWSWGAWKIGWSAITYCRETGVGQTWAGDLGGGFCRGYLACLLPCWGGGAGWVGSLLENC